MFGGEIADRIYTQDTPYRRFRENKSFVKTSKFHKIYT